ncbi:hypothetical protein ACN08S_26315 [Photobacterium leiognathi subsp. mandapamensis]|uniref:hypothetical protein n=1 Tax=Photobacterium leiognathi TaxID=553611 RepID=UPI003AF352B6
MKENKIIENKDKKPFNQWKYGDLINGAKLTTVYIKKEELIVYIPNQLEDAVFRT